MASCVLHSDVSLSSLGKNFLVGTTIGLGIGVGVGTGLLIIRKIAKTTLQDKEMLVCMQELTNEMKELRLVISRQPMASEGISIVPVKETKITKNEFSTNSLRDLQSINSDEDEELEFYDFNQDELEVPQEVMQSVSSTPGDDIKSIIQDLETMNNQENDAHKSHQFLQSAVRKHPNSGELLWRLGKSYYEIASQQGKEGFLEEKKNLLYKGLAQAQKSVEIGSKIASAHKWYALLLGSTADYESTQDRILLGFKYKNHISKAIELNDRDPSSYHLLGRWCYEVSQLPWWQRQAAAALFAEPPTSTVEEALENFLKAEDLDPGFWLTNSFWIAKCYYGQSQYGKCREWLQRVLQMEPKSEDDEKSLQEAQDLVQKL